MVSAQRQANGRYKSSPRKQDPVDAKWIHQFHQFVPTLDTLFSQKFKFLGHMDHVEAIQDPVNRNLWMRSGIHQFHPSAQTLSLRQKCIFLGHIHHVQYIAFDQ